MKKVLVSGGFDPLHIGHVQLFKAAKKLGDYLIVLINNNSWLMAKKGFVFMAEQERKAIIEAIKYVDEARLTSHTQNPDDMSVSADLEQIKPDIFANGGDRKPDGDPIPEVDACERMGIKIIYNVGGGKAQSSSELVHKALGIKSKRLK